MEGVALMLGESLSQLSPWILSSLYDDLVFWLLEK